MDKFPLYSKSPPLCFFPTNVLLLDDDVSYLDDLATFLQLNGIFTQMHAQPAQALDVMEQAQCFCSSQYANNVENYDEAKLQVLYNVCNMYNEVYNRKRFDYISTCIIDFNMPFIDGLQVCSQISEMKPHVQKILLTGKSEEHLAEKAFNAGIINCYLRKESVDIHNTLIETIKVAQKNFFHNITKNIFEEIIRLKEKTTAIDKKSFNNIFFDITNTHKIVEYYFFDTIGSCLMLDAKGNNICLFVKNEKEMEAFAYEAKNATDDELKQEHRDAIIQHKNMLCYHSPDPSISLEFPPLHKWPKYLRQTEKLNIQGQSFYYTIVENMFKPKNKLYTLNMHSTSSFCPIS